VSRYRHAILLSALLVVASARSAQGQRTSPVMEAMKAELARSLEALKTQPTPPYFLSYAITEVHSSTVKGAFGAVIESGERRRRALDVDVRVGDYKFDNTHPVRGPFPDVRAFLRFGAGSVPIVIDDDPLAIRAVLWRQTDREYKRAVEQLTSVRTNAEVGLQAEDSSPDFSTQPAATYADRPASLDVDRRVWEDKIRRYTAPFARYGDIYQAEAVLSAEVETRWYASSEGREIQTSQPIYHLYISAFSKADDGMELPRYESFWAFTPEGLPDDRVILQAVQKMIADLHALRRAPVLEPYTGPAILSGRASAVFFHEVFGHRVEGHRLKRESEGQTFAKKVNEQVLPEGFSVYFDPTLRRFGNADLAGFYRYDDEGVEARRVAVVERGLLKTFLMSRSPIQGFSSSNGHGRAQVGFAPEARQSNLIVEAAQSHSRAELTRMLIDEIKRQHKTFGLYFDDIEGGFTTTGRFFPNVFEVLPVMVYRIYPDGREELVRGADFIGTPLIAFSKIVAADDDVAVFNGLCGAESGFIPVAAVSPGILVSQVEVQKKPKSQERPPILPPPFTRTSQRAESVSAAARGEP
jgi:TldD protein